KAMPPKITFNHDDVVAAGLEIVKENGIHELSARKIAERLRSSTAPIYSSFGSIEALKHDVLSKAKQILLEYTGDSYTDTPFLNMGVGVVLFAREYPMLFRALFLESFGYKDIIDDLFKQLLRVMDSDATLTSLSSDEKKLLLERMWIFTYGLATIVCVGQIEIKDKDDVIRILDPMGHAAIQLAGKNELVNNCQIDK
ncbi:MAG TPA: TetR/AcrR family transcriptional regulator, partial [Bacillota bacterium]|nr:TetR/AcrR family transcriptional regulator [Bacillota bacterium]